MTIAFLTPEIVQLLFVCVSLIMVFVAVVVLYNGIQAMNAWKHRIRSSNGVEVNRLLVTQPSRPRSRLQQRLEAFGNLLKPSEQKELSAARSRLLQAGYRNPNAVNIYYGVKYGLLFLFPGIIFLLLWGTLRYTASVFSSLDLYVYLFAIAAIGYFAPDIRIRFKIQRRKEQIGRGFPDALDLLVLCIESGLGLDAAMRRSANDIQPTHPVLSRELQIVTDGIRAGQSRQAAFEALHQRVDLEAVNNFTSLVTQTERLGVNMTESMRKIAESMRTRRRNEAERLAAQLPVKLVVPVILFIFPSIFIVTLLPAFLQLLKAFAPLTN